MLKMQSPPAERPGCPKCGHRMSHANLIPGMVLIGRRAFVCERCGNAEFIAEEVSPIHIARAS